MKKIRLILLILTTEFCFCQDDLYKFNFSYGLGYTDFAKIISGNNSFDFGANRYGKVMEISIERKISNTLYLGVGFSNHYHHSKTNGFYNDLLVQKDFLTTYRRDLYDVHLSRYFKWFYVSVGVMYYSERFNQMRSQLVDEQTPIIEQLKGYYENRADDFALFYTVGLKYPLKNYVDIGIKHRLSYGLSEVEAITVVAPFVLISF